MSWNHDFVNLPAALEALRAKQNRPEIDWRGVKVGHIDTGYTRHPVLGPWTGDSSPFVLTAEGLNCLTPGQLPFDDGTGRGPVRHPGHGTRTMSALCGKPAGLFAGCAPGLPVVPYRAVDDVFLFGSNDWVSVSQALRHALHSSGCNIISISLGGFLPSSEFGRTVDEAYEKGVIVVAAAGQKIDRVTYPGFYSRVIGVGGISRHDGREWIYNEYHDYADRVDVWAPADPILRADGPPNDANPPTVTGDGTSYATLHVVAAAAIWLLYRQDELQRYTGWRRNEAFWHALKRSQRWDRMPPSNNRYVNAVLDARDLLDQSLPDPATMNPNWRKAENERF